MVHNAEDGPVSPEAANKAREKDSQQERHAYLLECRALTKDDGALRGWQERPVHAFANTQFVF